MAVAGTTNRSELTLRVISALVLIAIALSVTWAGGLAFEILCAAGALLIVHEFTNIARPALPGGGWRATIFVCLAAVLAAWFAGGGAWALSIGAAIAVALVAASFFTGAGLWPPAGFLYASLPFLCMVLLRGDHAAGLHAILLLFAAVWGADCAAYFAGRAIGGPKLAPRISPNKTWSGFVGGLAGSILASAGILFWLEQPISWWAVPLSLALGIAAAAGDLLESRLKRRFGVKDSGRIIPGHGGVLDRIDGLVVAAVVAWVLGCAFGGDPASPGATGSALAEAYSGR